MADFGWAFVKGNLVTGSAPPSGAVQFNDGNNKFAASGDLVFISGSTSQLNLTGTLNVSGAINANLLNITVTEQNVVNISSTGSTKFGDTSDDLHQFTGSLNVLGDVSASTNISASAFYGDGSNLSNVTTNPAGADTQIQFNNSSNFGASSNLTFASDTLAVGGDISASVNISASAFYGDGSNLSGITTSPAGSDTQIQFNNSGDFGASSNLTFDGSSLDITGQVSASLAISASAFHGDGSNLTGIVGGVDNQIQFNSSGDFAGSTGLTYDSTTLAVTGNVSASVNISASAFYGDGSNLSGIATTLDEVTNNGNTTTNAMTASALNLTGLAAGIATNTNFLALDSNNNVVLTSSSGGNSTVIGEAEDGSYADGLFSDFTTSTLIGTAIDKFNEILKIIVPGPAPAVDRINYTNTGGIATKLSFETNLQATGTGYNAVASTGSFSSPPGIDDQYTVTTSGEDFRLGVYDGTQQVTGVVNFHVVEELKTSEVNYSHNAFGNAESGSLKLIVNGGTLHTLNLTASGAGNPNTGSASDVGFDGSGFINLSVTSSATDQNGSTYDIFQHRTTDYTIHPDDQRKGWNYAKVEHVYGGTTYVTNFVQWFNDTDASSNAMAVSNSRVTFTGNGSKYLSGVQYFRSASLIYNADVSNVYKFTYPTGNVLTFNVDTGDINAIATQTLQATDGTDLFNKIVKVTGSTATNDDTMLDDSTTISINLEHPLKTNLSSTGSVATSGILIYNVDTANSNLDEKFDLEDFRITNGNYEDQVDVTDSSATWNSQNHMTGGGASGHTDGLIMYNGRLRSPRQGANSGDFSSLANGPAGNPDYSGVSGTKTFFRKIQNTSGGDIRDLKITSTKSSRYNNSSLTTNNAKFSIKLPDTSAWLDISQPFTYGAISVDGNGALISGANDNSNTGTSNSGNSVHCVTFGTASVANNQYVVIKIEADGELWTGNINRLQFQLGASDTDNAITPDTVADLNLSDTAGVEAKLSFGGDNVVDGYSKVGGIGSLSAVNSNGVFTDDSDVTRGVFSAFEAMGGTINPTASTLRDGTNDTFYNGYTGSLVLEVNGTEYGAIDLAANRNASSSISSNTGLSVSAVGESETSDGIPDFRLHYRTGTYSVGTGEQRLGWNYARVIHRVGGTDTTTNYVQWVVDTSASTDTAISAPTLTNFGHSDVYYQSGIGYFASNPTASFSFSGSNFYNNVYQNGNAISFPTLGSASINTITGSGTGLTTLATTSTTMAMPALDNSADCETTEIVVTASLTYNGGTSISGGLGLFTSRNSGLTGRIIHPLKTDRTSSLVEKTGFMRFSGSLGSSNLNTNEYFGFETYRIVSGNYANQASVIDSSNTWNSQTHMNAANAHGDGMVTINNKAISPLKIGNAGDTRNAAESGVLQAPNGNPDYSSLSENIRTYYRYFRNETGQSKPTFTLTLYGDANLVAKSGAFYTGTLGSNKNINVELKVPTDPAFSGLDDTSTAWADCIKPFSAGTQPDTDGVGIFNGGGSDLNQTVVDGGRAIALQLQEKQVRDDQYFIVKISAHKDWTGYLSRIEITY